MSIKKNIELFLPKYLSPTEKQKLTSCLKDFPSNLDSRFYTNYLRNESTIFQGDGISAMQITDLPNSKIFEANSIILSNTCDVETENSRLFSSRLTYAPIIEIEKYIKLLNDNKIESVRITNHIKAIKEQSITQILYLPANSAIKESIVFLDRINNCSNDYLDRDEINSYRLFTLSNYGFYLFLLKLSMSFSRIAEKVNRK